jgi:hypothetical protein
VSVVRPDVSLVVCTRNRSSQLWSCLNALSAIRSSRHWEIVVVDNGSSDDTQEVLARFASTSEIPVRVVLESAPGLGNARNRGWRAAAGEVVAFTDDDCYPAPDYVELAWECITADERRGFAGGTVLLHDPDDAPITVVRRRQPVEIAPHSFVPLGLVSGACMVFRRQALASIGGFDGSLGAGTPFCFEDGDAVARAAFAGWSGIHDPRLSVRHHHGRRGADARLHLRVYDRGRGAYYVRGILDPRMRRAFAVASLRLARKRIQQRQLGMLLRELGGALAYLAYRRKARRRAAQL